jgi:predicted CopG family antitoxin
LRAKILSCRRNKKLRTINETFTDEEFQKLQTVKGQKSWHDFIMRLAKNKGEPQT